MKCELEDTCKLIYSKYKKKCYLHNTKLKHCKLKYEFYNDKISDIGIDILKNNIKKTYSKGITCPRSKNKISVKCCTLKECPYNSDIVYYNCIIIHSQHFFNGIIPKHLILLKDSTIEKKLFISIVLCRLIILMNKYESDYIANGSKSFIINKKRLILCSICGKLHDNSTFVECECNDRKIFKRRKTIERRWKRSLSKDYNITETGYIKQFLKNLRCEKISLKTISLGYLLKMYDISFKDKIAEAFGLDNKTYEKMVKEWI